MRRFKTIISSILYFCGLPKTRKKGTSLRTVILSPKGHSYTGICSLCFLFFFVSFGLSSSFSSSSISSFSSSPFFLSISESSRSSINIVFYFDIFQNNCYSLLVLFPIISNRNSVTTRTTRPLEFMRFLITCVSNTTRGKVVDHLGKE